MQHLLPLTLLFLASTLTPTLAGTVEGNQTCSQSSQKLQAGSYQFSTDCDSMYFCNSSSVCDWKKCRIDEFAFGYASNVVPPPTCPDGQFCPDEESACQSVLAVGSACQFNRDDQCAGPPNWRELADKSGMGLNVNGSVCLNNICMYANVTLGLPCVTENTAYIVYSGSSEYVDIVSRGNCRLGLYCDSQQKVCMQGKAIGQTCDADKECLSYNCLASGVCGKSANTPNRLPFWVYIIVGIGIFGGMFATLIGMFFLHKGQRDIEREKRLQYWREQNAFRQNIMQMRETARNSLMSLPTGTGGSPRSTLYSRDGIGSEDSQLPMLHAATKSSALRHYVSDDGFTDDGYEGIVVDGGDGERRDHRF